MSNVRNETVCWAPECGVVIPPPRRGVQGRYCSAAHRIKALRRNGGTAPTEPFPPLEPTPLQQDATPATVVGGSGSAPRKRVKASNSAGPDADVLGQGLPVGRSPVVGPGNVTPPAVATAGKAAAPVQPPPEASPVAPVRTPERTGAHPEATAGAPAVGPTDTEAPAADDGEFRVVGSGRASRSDPGLPEAKAGGPEGTPDPPTPAKVTQLHVAITEDSTVPVEIKVHPMVAAYKADVAKLGKANDRQGLQVIEMAEKLVSSATSPAAAANLSKELQRLMDALEESSNDSLVRQDPSLIIRDRTLEKLRQIQAAGAAAEASA